MTDPTIIVDKAEGIARITLNRPDRLNRFTRAMHAELRDALADLGDARVVVLTGAGRGFCAGQDLNDRAVSAGSGPSDLGETVEQCWNPLVRTLASLPQPVIAKVNGVAAGAGPRLALPFDVGIALATHELLQGDLHVFLDQMLSGVRQVAEAVALQYFRSELAKHARLLKQAGVKID